MALALDFQKPIYTDLKVTWIYLNTLYYKIISDMIQNDDMLGLTFYFQQYFKTFGLV